MNDPGRLWSSIRRARLLEVLAVYASASFVALQVVALFQDKLGLPGWLFGATLTLLVVGLPVVVAVNLARESRRAATPGGGRRAAWFVGAGVAAAAALALLPQSRHVWRRLLAGGSSPGVVRLAVLPFENLTGDPGQEYLSDGLTDEMTAQLGRLHPEGLDVIARTSAARYKGSAKSVEDIGRELRVDYVLEGSARREADTVRVTGELVRVSDQTTVWTDSYQREITGILALQSEVARAIARSLALTLLPREEARLARTHVVDPDAYEAYLKGLQHMRSFSAPYLDAAERYFELALRKDPGYALAYAGLAYVWSVRQQMGMLPVSEAGPRVREAAERALALDSTLAEAHLQLANLRAWTYWDWIGAEPEYRKAIRLDPSLAEAHAFYAHYLLVRARPGEATAQAERALELDPLNETAHLMDAVVLVGARRYDAAVEQVETVLRTAPRNPAAQNVLAMTYAMAGKDREAFVAERAHIAAGDSAVAAGLDSAYAADGLRGAMRRSAAILARRATAGGAGALRAAQRYLLGGDRSAAFEWLERAYAQHDPNLPYVNAIPLFDPIRGDPRFQDVLERLGLP
ncbi:MAG TPA: hypothetical protein VKA44_04135 [Gemmatimonadota bacterium]|nr:hypothetical protein [Gemmatimonadota bacterium]